VIELSNWRVTYCNESAPGLRLKRMLSHRNRLTFVDYAYKGTSSTWQLRKPKSSINSTPTNRLAPTQNRVTHPTSLSPHQTTPYSPFPKFYTELVVRDKEDHAGQYRRRRGGLPRTTDPSDCREETPHLVLERCCPYQSPIRGELETARFGISGI